MKLTLETKPLVLIGNALGARIRIQKEKKLAVKKALGWLEVIKKFLLLTARPYDVLVVHILQFDEWKIYTISSVVSSAIKSLRHL